MKVIFIIPFPPKYENLSSETSSDSYIDAPFEKNAAGERVYFLKKEWGGIIGEHILESGEDVSWEVWRPDDNADRIYQYTFTDGMVFKAFPSVDKIVFNGIFFSNRKISTELNDALLEQCKTDPDTVVLLATTVECSRLLHKKIKKHARHVLYYHFLSSESLFPGIAFSFNPLALFHRTLLYLQARRRIKHIQHIQFLSEELAEKFAGRYHGKRTHLARIGMDLSFWQHQRSREVLREEKGIGKDVFVFLLSQRLVPEYQIDKWLQAVKLIGSANFLCIITGTGERKYFDYLSEIVQKNNLSVQIRFVGFISNEELRDYFTACDCFVSVGKKGGGSTGAIYAMAMNRKVLHTNSGVTYEILNKFGAGAIVGSTEYSKWPEIISDTINRPLAIKTVPEDYVRNLFDWRSCSREWIQAIKSI